MKVPALQQMTAIAFPPCMTPPSGKMLSAVCPTTGNRIAWPRRWILEHRRHRPHHSHTLSRSPRECHSGYNSGLPKRGNAETGDSRCESRLQAREGKGQQNRLQVGENRNPQRKQLGHKLSQTASNTLEGVLSSLGLSQSPFPACPTPLSTHNPTLISQAALVDQAMLT